VFSFSFTPPCRLVDISIPRHCPLIFLANALPRLRVLPWRHPVEEHLCERPHVIRHPRRHRPGEWGGRVGHCASVLREGAPFFTILLRFFYGAFMTCLAPFVTFLSVKAGPPGSPGACGSCPCTDPARCLRPLGAPACLPRGAVCGCFVWLEVQSRTGAAQESTVMKRPHPARAPRRHV
jgi:hypothetical protein